MGTHLNGKLQLPSVTLCIIDCIDAKRAIQVLEHCKTMVDFGAVKLLTHIPCQYENRVKIVPLNSLIAYSIFMLTRFHNFIDTDHVLIVQRDGWILNPFAFKREWLELDYIGPLFVQYDFVGSGGFSLRSKRLIKETANIVPEWNGTDKHAHEIQDTLGWYEDGIICLSKRLSPDYKIASLNEAADFAHGGNRNPEYFRDYPFGFHRTFADIDFKTGFVDYSDLSKDLHVTYDGEIDTL